MYDLGPVLFLATYKFRTFRRQALCFTVAMRQRVAIFLEQCNDEQADARGWSLLSVAKLSRSGGERGSNGIPAVFESAVCCRGTPGRPRGDAVTGVHRLAALGC